MYWKVLAWCLSCCYCVNQMPLRDQIIFSTGRSQRGPKAYCHKHNDKLVIYKFFKCRMSYLISGPSFKKNVSSLTCTISLIVWCIVCTAAQPAAGIPLCKAVREAAKNNDLLLVARQLSRGGGKGLGH